MHEEQEGWIDGMNVESRNHLTAVEEYFWIVNVDQRISGPCNITVPKLPPESMRETITVMITIEV